jgi:hypothetical protein
LLLISKHTAAVGQTGPSNSLTHFAGASFESAPAPEALPVPAALLLDRRTPVATTNTSVADTQQQTLVSLAATFDVFVHSHEEISL